MSPHIVLAGGGTAGHIEPMLAVADALRRLDPGVGITCVGTERGLETTLVPARGHELALLPAVPLPRKPTVDLLRVPTRLRGAVRSARELLERTGADAAVGFGGYAALPVYLAARRAGLPLVVHEQNPLPGLANKLGARFAAVVAVTTEGTPLPKAQVVGMPLRQAITGLDRAGLRDRARAEFGLDPDRPTLLVSGGSQGARTLNLAASAAAGDLAAAGVQVLHAIGGKNTVAVPDRGPGPAYVVTPYIERMDLAYAAADLMLGRAGAVTCAELSAVGLPAVFVPLPHGNGEQRRNAEPIVRAGGGVLVDDSDLTADWLRANVVPLVTDRDRLAAMSASAAGYGHRDADEVLARIALDQAAKGVPT